MSDDTDAARIARRAAARLAADLDPGLPEQVERTLADDPLARTPERALDPVSLGSLVVSLASLGWTIYRDTKGDRDAARADQAARAERLAARLLEDPTASAQLAGRVTAEQRRRVIDVLAEEIAAADP